MIEHLSMLKEARDRVSGVRPLVLSIDVPSGLNADQSKPIGPTVQADLTVTFTAAKPANVLAPACHFGGSLIVADIGSPASLIQAQRPWLFVTEAEDARQWLVSTRYTPESYKNTHGHVLQQARVVTPVQQRSVATPRCAPGPDSSPSRRLHLRKRLSRVVQCRR